VASIGGFVAGDLRYITYLSDHAIGSVFSAPLPGYCAGAALKSFEIMSTDLSLIKRVQENSLKLREKLRSSLMWPQNYPEQHKVNFLFLSLFSFFIYFFPLVCCCWR
jgi:7-keto-8-aminopelargonate synthetase-like enzyme